MLLPVKCATWTGSFKACLHLPDAQSLYCVLQTEIDRLKRQIAEKEAAVKAGQALLPAVTKV